MRKHNPKANLFNQCLLYMKDHVNSIILIGLVGCIAFFAWQFENRFYALFIVFFFIIALFFKRRLYFALIIMPIIIFMLFNTVTIDALKILIASDLPAIQHPKAELTTLFSPNAGLEVLPPKVLTMISILKENDIDNYKLSEKFSGDIVIYQRIVEGAWPIKPENNSPFTLISADEVNYYKDCEIIDEEEDVILVNCS